MRIPILEERVAVPNVAGLCDPLDHLSEPRRTVFENLISEVAPPGPPIGDLPIACCKVDPAAYPALVRKSLKANMVVVLPEINIPHSADGIIIVAGLFCVLHQELYDRLIVDRRPLNACGVQLGWARESLPAGSR